MDKVKQWEIAQEEEEECWKSLKQKLQSKQYFQEKSTYWKRLISRTKRQPADFLKHKTLEVGCGPTGIFLIFENEKEIDKENYHVLDPLIDSYKGIVPQYFKGIHGINSPLEEMNTLKTEPYKYVLAINCIDHCCDMDAFCKKLVEIASQDAEIYIAVNTHIRKSTARFWRAFQKVLEPLHPYHFTKEEYEERFKAFFDLKEVVDIEDLIIDVNNNTREVGNQPKPTMIRKFARMLRNAPSALHPRNIVFGVLRLFRIPAHDFVGVGNSIYRHKLFILKPRSE